MRVAVVFDLDGTLATSKRAIDPEMAELFSACSRSIQLPSFRGGDWPQFERQLLEHAVSRRQSQSPFCCRHREQNSIASTAIGHWFMRIISPSPNDGAFWRRLPALLQRVGAGHRRSVGRSG